MNSLASRVTLAKGSVLPMKDVISTNELQLALSHSHSAPLLLEALPLPYFEKEHLPGALNLPLQELDAIARERLADREQQLVVYCSGPTCQNSHVAAARLQQLGYRNVRVYAGGKQAWRDAGLPFESVPARAAGM